MPAGEDFALGIPFFWVRQDWLDNLGIEDLKFESNQDVVDLALRFMNEDPDQNGKDDTFGIVLDNTLDRYLRAFGHNIDQQVNMYMEKDGELIYSDIQLGMKDLLKQMNDMYTQGLLDKEFAVKDFNKATERLAAGEVGIFPMSFVVRGPFANNKMNQDFAEWTCIPLPPNSDGKYSVGSEKACFKWLVCNANFEYPEALVKGQNLWHELWQGDHAEYYHGLNLSDYAQAGEDFKLYPPFWFDPPLKNLGQGRVFPNAWDDKDRDSIISPETRKQYDRSIDFFENGNKELYTGWTNMHLFYMAFPTIDKVYGGSENIVYDAFTGPTTDVIASKQPLADKVRLEWLTKFIVGNEDIEASFDTYVDEWLSAGGQDVLNEANAWYKSR